MKTYEITIGIGSPFQFIKAIDEDQACKIFESEHSEIKRYSLMSEEERKESCVKFGFKNSYHIHELSQQAVENRIDEYKRWLERLEKNILEANLFLGQLNKK